MDRVCVGARMCFVRRSSALACTCKRAFPTWSSNKSFHEWVEPKLSSPRRFVLSWRVIRAQRLDCHLPAFNLLLVHMAFILAVCAAVKSAARHPSFQGERFCFLSYTVSSSKCLTMWPWSPWKDFRGRLGRTAHKAC